jgi:hypothetical protein
MMISQPDREERMEASRSTQEQAAGYFVDLFVPAAHASPPPGDASILAARVSDLERENIDLQKLVCELLSKNEELRRQIWRLTKELAAR